MQESTADVGVLGEYGAADRGDPGDLVEASYAELCVSAYAFDTFGLLVSHLVHRLDAPCVWSIVKLVGDVGIMSLVGDNGLVGDCNTGDELCKNRLGEFPLRIKLVILARLS